MDALDCGGVRYLYAVACMEENRNYAVEAPVSLADNVRAVGGLDLVAATVVELPNPLLKYGWLIAIVWMMDWEKCWEAHACAS